MLKTYYQQKYASNITIPGQVNSKGDFVYDKVGDFLNNIHDRLKEARNHSTDAREAFILGAAHIHATPLVYIKVAI